MTETDWVRVASFQGLRSSEYADRCVMHLKDSGIFAYRLPMEPLEQYCAWVFPVQVVVPPDRVSDAKPIIAEFRESIKGKGLPGWIVWPARALVVVMGVGFIYHLCCLVAQVLGK